jgi:amidohydrolase
MNTYFQQALEMKDEIIRHRRWIHQHAECGMDLPQTREYVMQTLRAYGYDPQIVAGGVTALIGSDGPVILLRADMDALPQKEMTDLPFASQNDQACHSCGHDCHTAMLLGATKLLKECESSLRGTVKLLFQPGEERLTGAKAMIKAGVLDHPHVDAAIALHMKTGPLPGPMKTGTLRLTHRMASADEFYVKVEGMTAHSSRPFDGRSALSAACSMVTQAQQLPALSVCNELPASIAFGNLHAGTAPNIIPDLAELRGTIRTFDPDIRQRLLADFSRIIDSTAAAWQVKASLRWPVSAPCLVSDEALIEELRPYLSQVADALFDNPLITGTEDFAYFSQMIPTVFIDVCAGGREEGCTYSMHDPHVRFDEDALAYGTAAYVTCAVRWLDHHANPAQ